MRHSGRRLARSRGTLRQHCETKRSAKWQPGAREQIRGARPSSRNAGSHHEPPRRACRENPRTKPLSSPPVCAAPRRPPLKAGRSGAASRSEADGERRRPGAQRKPRDARESASAWRGACATLVAADLRERVDRRSGSRGAFEDNSPQKLNPAACWRKTLPARPRAVASNGFRSRQGRQKTNSLSQPNHAACWKRNPRGARTVPQLPAPIPGLATNASRCAWVRDFDSRTLASSRTKRTGRTSCSSTSRHSWVAWPLATTRSPSRSRSDWSRC